MHWDVSNRKDPSQPWLFGRVFAELQHAWPVFPPNPMETSPLDPSLPGVRLLQSWIREQLPLTSRPVLINRRQISVIRSLG